MERQRQFGGREFYEIRMLEITNKSNDLVVYSSGGAGQYQAAQASAYAFENGYQNVYYFEDGLDKWKTAGYPVETGKWQKFRNYSAPLPKKLGSLPS